MSKTKSKTDLGTRSNPEPVTTDVFIAGSGPLGCTFARKILDNTQNVKIMMADVGAQDNPIIGRHHKNSAKYQKDIDAFVHVIQGALQKVSVPPASTYMATLGSGAWVPADGETLVSAFNNPDQRPEFNLPGCAVTRTVGGMATHWTCACPKPHPQEREVADRLLGKEEFDKLLEEAGKLLNVNLNEYDKSIRHNLVKEILCRAYDSDNKGGVVENLPLAVKRNDNPTYVTWSGSDTVLGKYAEGKHDRFDLRPEHKLIGFVREGAPNQPPNLERLYEGTGPIRFAYVKDIKNDCYLLVSAKTYVVACGAVGTPQILWNSGFGEYDVKKKAELPALGRYLTEQSISFCQIVLKENFIRGIQNSEYLTPELRDRCQAHHNNFPKDPIWIPFADPEPQVTIRYSKDTPWHTQIHRDAFSYGDVGPRADPRLIVDLRFFGRQECLPSNYVTFSPTHTDIYGMPQATFNVTRSSKDAEDDQRMMLAMCDAAHKLGPFLPDSEPQFMEPGLALHITGTTRLGKPNDDGTIPEDSVANEHSQVHGHPNLYVGGNNVIPDSTACNPTRTSVAYAIKACAHIIENLKAQGCT